MSKQTEENKHSGLENESLVDECKRHCTETEVSSSNRYPDTSWSLKVCVLCYYFWSLMQLFSSMFFQEIINTNIAEIYGVSAFASRLNVCLCCLVVSLVTVPSNLVVQAIGVKKSIIASSVISIVGCAVRLCAFINLNSKTNDKHRPERSMNDYYYFYYFAAGNLVIASSVPLCLISLRALVKYYIRQQDCVISGVGALGFSLGIGMARLLPYLLFTNMFHLSDLDIADEDILFYLCLLFILSALLVLLGDVLFSHNCDFDDYLHYFNTTITDYYYRNKDLKKDREIKFMLKQSNLRKISYFYNMFLTNRDFWILAVSGSLTMSTFIQMTLFAEPIPNTFNPLAYGVPYTTLLAVCVLAVCWLADSHRRLKALLWLLSGLTCAVYSGWIWYVFSEQLFEWAFFLQMAAFVLGCTLLVPLSVEMAAEVVFPCPMLYPSSTILCLTFMTVAARFLYNEYLGILADRQSNYIVSAVVQFIPVILLGFLDEQYKRSDSMLAAIQFNKKRGIDQNNDVYLLQESDAESDSDRNGHRTHKVVGKGEGKRKGKGNQIRKHGQTIETLNEKIDLKL